MCAMTSTPGADATTESADGRPARLLPPSTTEPGSMRLAENSFFTRFPGFLKSSRTLASGRFLLDLRHHAIFEQNKDLFEGARVLDIASHDGRWSMAAIDAGAAHVTGIEGRSELVDDARRHFEDNGVDPSRYRFVVGDVFEVMAREQEQYDVVLCLGFLYHTLRYQDLFGLIADAKPHHLIIDTAIDGGHRPVIRVGKESVERPQNAVADQTERAGFVLFGRPTKSAVRVLTTAYGYPPERYSDWAALDRDNPSPRFPKNYADGLRITVRCAAAD